jgi:catechol 2,3-dioxygenase-like lactoylglutathione lyase family enzyme
MDMDSKSPEPVRALKAHVALNVHDVNKSIEFYQKMLGIGPSKVRRGYAKFDVQNPPLNLTLNEVPFSSRGALSHMGIQVGSTQDVLTKRQEWMNAGLITRDEMETNCCYATQDKTWVQDPDGNQWEAFVVLQDNLQETGTCECASPAVEISTAVASGVARTSGQCCASNAN